MKFSSSIKTMKKALLFFCLALFLVGLSGCKDDVKVSEGTAPSKYTKEQIVRMMKYHGSLIAKYDGKRWWCLQGRRWIKVDSAKAARFARIKGSRLKKNSL